MVDNILKARENGVVSDIGVQRPGGDYAVAAFDEDSYNKLIQVLAELQELNDNGTLTLSASTLAALEEITVTVTGLQTDALTDAELRATDVEVNDDMTHSRLTMILTELQTLNAFDKAKDSTSLAIKGVLDSLDAELSAVLSELSAVLAELSTQQKNALTNTELRATPVVVDNQHDQPVTQAQLDASLAQALADAKRIPTLTERMFVKRVETGYQLWLDTSDSSHLYTAEGPVGDDPATDATWRGVRVTLDATGFPNGPVEVADGFVWDDRTSFGGWA